MVALCCCGSSTCTDASNLGRFRPCGQGGSPHSILLTSLKKQKEETEEQLEKTQTIQKTKIFVFRAVKKKIRNGNVFLEVFEIFQISASGEQAKAVLALVIRVCVAVCCCVVHHFSIVFVLRL